MRHRLPLSQPTNHPTNPPLHQDSSAYLSALELVTAQKHAHLTDMVGPNAAGKNQMGMGDYSELAPCADPFSQTKVSRWCSPALMPHTPRLCYLYHRYSPNYLMFPVQATPNEHPLPPSHHQYPGLPNCTITPEAWQPFGVDLSADGEVTPPSLMRLSRG